MKKLLLLLVAFATISLTAQVTVFEEDFESGAIPGTFTLHDEDGLTPAAAVNWATEAWTVRLDFTDDTDNVAGSTSWYDPAGTADDWMVTPQIDLTGYTNSSLSFDVNAQDPAFPDGYQILVSITGTAVADFTDTISDVAAAENGWSVQTLDLSAYDGMQIHIAFRNNSNNQFILLVDDIKVEANSTASTNDLEAVGFSFSPNPASDFLSMKANTAINEVIFYNILGEKVLQVLPNSLESSIDISKLSSGAYFVQAQVGDSKGTFKVVKK